ncbi:MAG: hypothetical protein O7J95_02635 [Planctomycetota bacterium]|nr:hypothetical protein [Planctomycetota bacterium]
MRTRRRWCWWAAAALGAALLTLPFVLERTAEYYTDGSRIHSPAAESGRSLRKVLWEPPRPLNAEVNHPERDDYEPRVSPDGDLLLFTRGRPGDNADLWRAERRRGEWRNVRPLVSVNTPKDELGAAFSPDGEWLYFYSNRDGGQGGYDIWASRRQADGWSPAVNLGAAVNSAWNEMSPAPGPKGRRLYFTTDRRPGRERVAPWTATLRARLEPTDCDVYVAERPEDGGAGRPGETPVELVYAAARPVEQLNRAAWADGAVAVSPAGDFLFFASNRPAGFGGFDLYRTRLLDGELLPAESLGPEINSPEDELDPALSSAGFELYFARNRGGQEDIFFAFSREVFVESESQGPYWSFSGVLDFLRRSIHAIPPDLFALLLFLLLCLIVLHFLRKLRVSLNLLAHCFVIALLLHALLALWMNRHDVHRIVLEALEREQEPEFFEISLESLPEESVGQAIREALAETQNDPEPRLAAREPRRRSPEETWDASPSSEAQPAALVRSAPPAEEPLAVAELELALPAPPHLDLEDAPLEIALPDRAGERHPPEVESRRLPRDLPQEVATVELVATRRGAAVPGLELDRAEVPPMVRGRADRPADPGAIAIAPLPAPAPSRPGTGVRGLPGELPDAALPRQLPERSGPPAREIAKRTTELENTVLEDTVRRALRPGPAKLGPSNGLAARRRAGPAEVASPTERTTGTLERPRRKVPPFEDSGTTASLRRPVSSPRRAEAPELPPTVPRSESPSRAPELARRLAPPPTTLPRPDSETPAALRSRRRRGTAEEDRPAKPVARERLARASLRPPRLAVSLAPLPRAALAKNLRGVRGRRPLLDEIEIDGPTPTPAERPSRFLPRIYRLRERARRDEVLRARGGSEETERAVEAGLAWLALHQSPDGRWSLRDYTRHLGSVSARDVQHPDWNGRGRHDSRGGSGKARNGDTAATGLALLAFLGHGDTHLEKGPYRETVARGLAWLVGRQGSNGDLRGGGNLYMHGIAAFALCEAYAFTRDASLRDAAQNALRFTEKSQNPSVGGWRYDPYPRSRDVDTSVFGWMLMAVKSGRLGGLDVDERSLVRAARYLDRARMPGDPGRFLYQPGNARTSLAMTAQGFFCQQMLADTLLSDEQKRRPEYLRATGSSVRYLLSNLPRAADMEGVNFYYWYYASLALFQVGGDGWEAWNSRLSRLLVAAQVGEEHGTAHGSWDPRGRRASTGGRLYSTALSVLCLEVYYRYAPLEDR